MKFVLVVATVLAAAYGAHIAKQEIDKMKLLRDLLEFEALKPLYQMSQILGQYRDVDKEYQNFMKYGASDDFKKALGAMIQTPEAIALFDYLHESGLFAHQYANMLADFADIEHLFPQAGIASLAAPESQAVAITGGLAGLAADLKKLMPFDKFEQLHFEKLKTSPEYAAFFDRIMAPEFQVLAENFGHTKSFANLFADMSKHGIDVLALIDLSCSMIGVRDCGALMQE